MIYVLLSVFPIAIAGACFLLRRQTQLVTWLGVATLAFEVWLALTAPINQPARLLELAINYNSLSRLLLTALCLGLIILTLLGFTGAAGEYSVATSLVIVGTSAAMLIVQEPFVVAVLLLVASLIGSLQLVDQPVDAATLIRPQTLGMAVKYTLMIVLGGLFLLLGFILATAFDQQLATSGPALRRAMFGLLVVGFSIRAGLIPFHLWLPDLLDETAPATIFVQTGILSVLALPVLLVALQTQPELLIGNTSGQRLLLTLGGLSAVLGSVAAMISAQPRRAIAFIAIANMGLLVIGLGTASSSGVTAALLGALNHLLGLVLITVGLALLERQVPGRREQAGALRERPLAAITFVTGCLLLIGVPPLSGFLPKLLLLNAAAARGPLLTGLVLLSLVLLAGGIARLLRVLLLQPKEGVSARNLLGDDVERLVVAPVPYAPLVLRLALPALIGSALALGLWPQPVMAQLNETVQTLTFLSR